MAGRKDTKRWCGGHVGREHKLQCMVKRYLFDRSRWYVLACTVCGKELANYFPFFSFDKKHRPSWVKEDSK